MKKVLIAVDDKGSKAILSTFFNLVNPAEEVVLLNVQRLEGKSLMIDMLGDAEMSTLKDSINGTEHKDKLDKKAADILGFYEKEIGDYGSTKIKKVSKEGIPADEILKVAEEEGADLIIVGNKRKKGFSRFVSGNFTDEVQKLSKVPVLVARGTLMCEEPYSWKDAYAAVTVTMAIIVGMFLLGIILQNGTLLH
ncbi:MAG TPA: universal stress protein [Candidatus Sulfobium mesophilum]|nr:universal stress protein [Candidatus Sulfobium mesophilum]